MNATLVAMGYRGEDAFRTRTDSRRQPPWQSSSGTGPGAPSAGNDGSRGYSQQDEHAAAAGYGGYPRGDSYDGYEDYRQDAGYGQPGQQGQQFGYDDGYSGEYGPGDGAGYGQFDDHGYGQGNASAPGSGYGPGTGYGPGSGYGQPQDDTDYGQPGPGGYEAHGGGYRDGYSGGYGGTGYTQPRAALAPSGTDHQTGGYPRPGNYPALPAGGAGNQRALPSGYAQSGDYPAQAGGYGRSGDYPAQAGGYGRSGDYPAQPGGYGQSGDFPTQVDGYGRSGDYAALPSPGYGLPSGQHARPGAYGASGDYPALGDETSGRVDLPGRYAGNDWYGGQPGAATPGSGFADTGTLDARAIKSYGSGPYPALQETPDPPGLVHTGMQEQYVEDDYEPYPGYQGQDGLGEHRDYAANRGYDGPQGYDRAQGYDDRFDQPAGFGAGGYAPVAAGGAPGGYDDYADEDDPYQDRYGDGRTAPRFPVPGKKGKPRGSKAGGMRVRRPLLIGALAVVAVIVLGAAAYTFVFKPKPSAGNSPATSGPLPTAGSTSAATAACVKQFGEYCHIELRTDDPTPLTLDELFPPQFLNEADHNSFSRVAAKLDKTCANAVIGQDLVSALQSGKCTQVLRASYVAGDGKIMGTIGVVNLDTTNEAHHAGKVVGANDFIAPLSAAKGIASKLGKGTGVVEAEFKGHYLILTWAEFTSTNAPATKAQNQQLEAFENDLVAGTANISLSQRMVNGKPATAVG